MSGKTDVYSVNITPNLLHFFKHVPITSIEVEHIFSLYKYILSDKRFNFNEYNMEIYLIINFNLKNLYIHPFFFLN